MQTSLAISTTEQNLNQADAVINLSKKWRKGMMSSLLKGVLIALLAIAALVLIAYVFIDFRIVF
jgi:hypothetical protein